MYKNMKIEITDIEQLKAVCEVLENLGITEDVIYHSNGCLLVIYPNTFDPFIPCVLVTLAELKGATKCSRLMQHTTN